MLFSQLWSNLIVVILAMKTKMIQSKVRKGHSIFSWSSKSKVRRVEIRLFGFRCASFLTDGERTLFASTGKVKWSSETPTEDILKRCLGCIDEMSQLTKGSETRELESVRKDHVMASVGHRYTDRKFGFGGTRTSFDDKSHYHYIVESDLVVSPENKIIAYREQAVKATAAAALAVCHCSRLALLLTQVRQCVDIATNTCVKLVVSAILTTLGGFAAHSFLGRRIFFTRYHPGSNSRFLGCKRGNQRSNRTRSDAHGCC